MVGRITSLLTRELAPGRHRVCFIEVIPIRRSI
jgi:hypothetical protein